MQECLKGRFLPLQVGERVGFGARSGCALFPVPWSESKKVFRSVDLGRDGDGDPTRRVGGVSIWTATHTKIPVDQSEAEYLFD